MLDGTHQPLPTLVHAMIVGQIEVSKTMFAQRFKPFRFASEDEFLMDWRFHLSGRTFQIADDKIGSTQQGVHPFRKERLHTLRLNLTPHSTVEQDITSESQHQLTLRLGESRYWHKHYSKSNPEFQHPEL